MSEPVSFVLEEQVRERLRREVDGVTGQTGGVLLGRREVERIVVEDFEPVPPEQGDSENLRETLEWCRSGAIPGVGVLGFYRTHAAAGWELSTADEELQHSYFRAGEDVVLLLKPDGEFHFCRTGQAPEAASFSWPPPRPRLAWDAEPANRQGWLWYAAAAVLGLAGGALGYLALHTDRSAARNTAPAAQTKPSPTATAQPTVAAKPPVQASDADREATEDVEIRALLDRWAGALKHGDTAAAAACYAPLVSTYYTRHNVPREQVRQSIRQTLVRHGGLEIYRISGLQIAPVSEGRAVASFRKHWQTAGRKKVAGEEQERMTLVRDGDAWQIASEQETREEKASGGRGAGQGD